MDIPLDASDPVKWRRLATGLRALIASGTIRPGSPVPSITVIAADLGWARATVSQAMRALAGDGVLTRHKGLGYYVTPPPPPGAR
jgi:DNA-binding GntR family transcriptional regulator